MMKFDRLIALGIVIAGLVGCAAEGGDAGGDEAAAKQGAAEAAEKMLSSGAGAGAETASTQAPAPGNGRIREGCFAYLDRGEHCVLCEFTFGNATCSSSRCAGGSTSTSCY